MICVSLAEPTEQDLLKQISETSPYADLIEIRLDFINKYDQLDLEKLIYKSSVPVLFTNRAPFEGGRFKGSEQERIDLLCDAVRAGADYVDIELQTKADLFEKLMTTARRYQTKTICSFHDFRKTPEKGKLDEILNAIQRADASIGKIVTMAQAKDDISRLLSLYSQGGPQNFRLIAFCMGRLGRISRVASLAMGAPFAYAAPQSGSETAPGQIPAREMKTLIRYLQGDSDLLGLT